MQAMSGRTQSVYARGDFVGYRVYHDGYFSYLGLASCARYSIGGTTHWKWCWRAQKLIAGTETMDMIKKRQIRADAALQSPTHLRRSAVLWFGFL